MNYKNALLYLNNLASESLVMNGKRTFSLEGVKCVLNELGNPQQSLKVFHVAGSKGKGSISAMLAAILRVDGYQVGLFTSPHLQDVRERIGINDQMISEKDFGLYASRIFSLKSVECLSYFEFLTVLAILYFVEKKLDYAVFEVGLGGRLDATNVLKPMATLLGPVELEHREILGDTLTKIAKEKLGIVKAQVPLFLGIQKQEIDDLAYKICSKVQAPLFSLSREVSFKIISRSLAGYCFDYLERGSLRKLRFCCSLLGDHQVHNAVLAIMAVRNVLPKMHTNNIRRGLNKVCWSGRFQYLKKSGCQIILDVAHTVESIKAFLFTYRQLFDLKPKVMMLSFLRDKAVAEIFNLLVKQGDKEDVFILTSSVSSRAFKAFELRKFVPIERQYFVEESPVHAFKLALKMSKNSHAVICVLGSHCHIGELFAAGEVA